MAKQALNYQGYRSTSMRDAFIRARICSGVDKKLVSNVAQCAKRTGFVVLDNSFQDVPLSRMSERSWQYVNKLNDKPVMPFSTEQNARNA